jgi:hypothetical protein
MSQGNSSLEFGGFPNGLCKDLNAGDEPFESLVGKGAVLRALIALARTGGRGEGGGISTVEFLLYLLTAIGVCCKIY